MPKFKNVLLSSLLAVSLVTTSITPVLANEGEEQAQNVQQHYLKVLYDGKVLHHEKSDTQTIVQVLDNEGQTIISEVLTSDDEIELEKPKLTSSKMLSYWDIETTKNKVTIKPVIIDEKAVLIKFTALEGGELVEDNKQLVEVLKTANKDTPLKDVLPKTNPKKGYKFSGFYETVYDERLEDTKDIKIDEEEKLKSSRNAYVAKFYPDLNDNGIDDNTEKITIKFATDAFEKIDDLEIQVGNTLELPKMAKDDYIFYGWYYDKDFKTAYMGEEITQDTTFYAKWEKAKEVVKEAEEKPITDKNISDQVEKYLKEKEQAEKGNNINKTPAPKAEKPKVTNPQKEVTQPNKETSSEGNNKGSSEDKKEDKADELDKDLLGSFTETKYVYDNKNVGKRFMVKFYDENEDFIMSLTLPYGQTIKTFDENETERKEYGVRQNTTIVLNSNEYVSDIDTLQGFSSRKKRINASEIVEITPNVMSSNNWEEEQKALEEQAELTLQAEKQKQKATWLMYGSIGLLLVVLIALVVIIKKRKKQGAQEM